MEPITIFLLVFVVVFFFSTFKTVAQGTIGVVTTFGKYRRIMLPGLNFKLSFIETIYKRISIQNRSAELEFQAITSDQATVQFKALLLFAVLDQQEETIKNVAFKFVDEKNFMQTLVRTVEGSVRSFVASQKQAEILGSRTNIVDHVKHQIDQTLEMWGYHLIDMQMNDIAFDSAIMKSMAQVVASNNLKAAAENEGQALLITKTKQAEAEGNAIKIAAAAEKDAAQLRGQGISLFREEAAKGMSQAIKQLEGSHIDASVILFSMWTETIRHVAEHGKGNVIFLDGSVDGMEHSIKQLLAMNNGGLWKGNQP